MSKRYIHREYLRARRGIPARPEGTIEGAIGRDPSNRLRYAIRADGRPAVTHYTVREKLHNARRADLSARDRANASDPRPSRRVRTPGLQRSALRSPRSALSASRASAACVAACASSIRVTKEQLTFEVEPPPDYAARTEVLRRVTRSRCTRRAAARAAGRCVSLTASSRRRRSCRSARAATVKALDAARPARARRADHSREHVPSLAAPRARDDRRRRRPAPLHGLGSADPHRQRRLPGLQPGVAAHARRRRRHAFARTSTEARTASRRRASSHSRKRSGVDIAMALDVCVKLPASETKSRGIGAPHDAVGARAAPRRGSARPTRCSSGSCRAGSTNGCARAALPRSLALDLPGYAIGGLSVGETRDEMARIVRFTAGCSRDGRAT